MEGTSLGDSGSGTAGQTHGAGHPVVIRGDSLTIDDVVRAARYRAKIKLTDDGEVLGRVEASHAYIINATEACRPQAGTTSTSPLCKPIYGVTTGFGGMATLFIPRKWPENCRRI